MDTIALSKINSAPPTSAKEGRVAAFFSGAGLPVFVLSAVLVYEILLLAIVFAPAGWGVWSSFSVEFKVWCFGYDVRTGGMQWAAFGVMVAEPLFIAATAAFLWRRALAALRGPAERRRAGRACLAGCVVACLVVGGLFAYGRPANAGEASLPFPGARIRTAIVPAPFRFKDHRGASVGLEELRGRVVLVTGIYAMCSTSCPEIIREIKTLRDQLPEQVRKRLTMLALSLNPEYDTQDLMARLAEGYGFAYPDFRYVNGEPDRLGETLQALGFARVKNVETGMIEHANLVLLVDVEGRIAYRFNLSSMHKGWLQEAVVSLAAEVGQ